MCAPSPPPAPDYASFAEKQGALNINAAKTQGEINNPNVVTPYGTQTVKPGTFNAESYLAANPDVAKDPYFSQNPEEHWTRYGTSQGRTGSGVNQFTIEQKFSPEQQALYDQSNATKLQLSNLAGQGATALQGVVGKSVDFSGAPQTGSYDDTRNKVISAMMSRTNEDYRKRTEQDRSNLIAAGIRPGSQAYDDNQQMIERGRNDAVQQAEIAGGNAAAQAYNTDQARRQQAITEQLAQRQTPINEISALMSGSQVSNPFSTPGYAQNGQVAASPLMQAGMASSQYGTDIYNQQAATAGNQQGGLIGLGGTALMAGGLMM